MTNKILKFGLITSMLFLLHACGDKMPDVLKTVSLIEAVSDKEGFLPFKMYFIKNEDPYIQYIDRNGKLKSKIKLDYLHEKKEGGFTICFFADEWDGVYQIKFVNGNVVKINFVNEKLKRDVSYSIERCEKREIIQLEEHNNMRYISVEINGMRLKFMLDTGCSDILISEAEATVLVKQGLLKEEDFLGTSTHSIADGSIVEGDKINLRTLKIGSKTIKNVKATIFYNSDTDLLLGQSILSQFGKYTIDNKKNELILE